MAPPLALGTLKQAGESSRVLACSEQPMKYVFEWDPNKADENIRKHKVSFLRAATIFRDPLARSVFDQEHSDLEERWISIGQSSGGEILVAVHTFREMSHGDLVIRIISARRATRREELQYRENK